MLPAIAHPKIFEPNAETELSIADSALVQVRLPPRSC
jgi:hypothetical protein